MSNTTLQIVSVNKPLDSFINENLLIKDIVDKIKSIPNFDNLKNDIKLVEHILQIIINHNTSLKSDIKDIATKVILSIFPDTNQQVLKANIDFLIDIDHIKAVSLVRRYYRSITVFFLNKLSP